MCRAGWSVLTEVEGLAHAHELQACCCIQVTQQAIVGLVRNRGLAVGAWCPAPQTVILQETSTAHVVCWEWQHEESTKQRGSEEINI